MNALKKPSYLRAFEEFLYKPAYFFLCAALTVFANICGAELFTYTCFVLIVLYLCLMGRDLLPIPWLSVPISPHPVETIPVSVVSLCLPLTRAVFT